MEVTDLRVVGQGLQRPEDVVVRRDGQTFVSDASSTVCEVLADGTLRHIGPAASEPNGLCFTPDGTAVVIAEFGTGQLIRCELATGEVTVLCEEIEGRPISRANYPVVLRDGSIYCTSSTSTDLAISLMCGAADGFVFRVGPEGSGEVVADGMLLPNGMAVDMDQSHLYVVRTTAADVVRFPILADGRLGPEEPYGPKLGDRTEWGEEAAKLVWGDDPVRDFTTADFSMRHKWAFPDGCAFDVEGNLWVAVLGRSTIVAITPDQEVLEVACEPSGLIQQPSNISFGGPDMRDVYFGTVEHDYVVRGRSSVPGLELTGQQ
jgi:gluconolactonase